MLKKVDEMLKKSFLLALLVGFGLSSCKQDPATGQGKPNPNSNNNSENGGDSPQITEVKQYQKPDESVESKCPPPRTMRDLSGGLKKLFYQFNSDNSANLSLFGMASVKLGRKEVMMIVDFIQYKDSKCAGTGTVRFAVGARLFLHIKQAAGSLRVTDLPKLAAGVELGKASITYSIETVGLTGDAVRGVLPNTGDFNVEAYGKVVSAIDKIQMLAKDGQEGVVIDPQIVPVAN